MSDKPITIKIIVDNNAADKFLSEHGFSVYIENGTDKIIFDCGQSDAFIPNIATAGIDLADINKLVVSHGHYDHTGAIRDILNSSNNIALFAHPDIFETRYSIHAGKDPRNISIKNSQVNSLNDLPENQKHFSNGPVQISDNIYLTGEIARNNDFEDTGGPFYLDTEQNVADIIYDDQSLCIETVNGVVLLTGCCHSGIVNTMDHIQNFLDRNIYMVIGGLHLNRASKSRLKKTIKAFNDFGVERIIPCHCTGEEAVKVMRKELGDIVEPGYAGMEIEL